MEFIKPGTRIDFLGFRRYGVILSGILILISVLSLIVHGGPNLGVDFKGGTLIQLKVPFSQQLLPEVPLTEVLFPSFQMIHPFPWNHCH